jgi:ABC-type multidrug transport system ATPase subunit
MQADVIHIMQNGRIIESGSHEELLNGAWSLQRGMGKQEKREPGLNNPFMNLHLAEQWQTI